MIFRQMFDSVSCTYTYLLAARLGGEALIIDPVLDNVDRYIQLIDELGLKLAKAVDTHVHADHITGLGALRDHTRCITVMGRKSKVDVVSERIDDGDTIDVEGISLRVLYTPGHTDDSYSFYMADRIFTGDTLFIRGTGRTDFQNGNPYAAYDSLFNKVLRLPDETLVYPGHDYKGDTVSTIGEEKAHNPRLQVKSAAAYAEIMENLKLADPTMMDEAVPANLAIGYAPSETSIVEGTMPVDVLLHDEDWKDAIFVDLREENERRRDGIVPQSVHAPYLRLGEYVKTGGVLNVMAAHMGRPLVLYCAFGERSAMALKAAREAGIDNIRHMGGGIDAWIKAGGLVEKIEP